MAAVSAGSPRARIYVVSIPDVYRLWVILKDNLLARFVWRTFDGLLPCVHGDAAWTLPLVRPLALARVASVHPRLVVLPARLSGRAEGGASAAGGGLRRVRGDGGRGPSTAGCATARP